MPLRRRFFALKRNRTWWYAFIGVLVFLTGSCSIPATAETPNIEPTIIVEPVGGELPTATSVPGESVDNPTPIVTPQPTEDKTPFDPLSVSATDCEYGGAFKTIEATDRFTVRFELCDPDTAFLSKIAFPAFSIHPTEWFEARTDGSAGLVHEAVVGTGPYRVIEWRAGEELVFGAYDGYWGGQLPGSDALVFRWDLDEVQRLLDLQAGVADGVDNISSFDYSTVQSDPNLSLVTREPLSTAYLGINNTEAPLNDERVRQAIALGIDRDEILGTAYPLGYSLANYFTPCAIPNGCEGTPWYTFDPEQALELLEAAGYPNGFESVLTYRDVSRGYMPRPGAVAEAIKEQLWNNLGIDVELEVLESETFLEMVDTGSFTGMYLLGWGGDYPDTGNFLDPHFGEHATGQFGNPYIDLEEVLSQGAAVYGDAARKPYYQAANNLIRTHVPAIPLAHGGWYAPESQAVAYRNSVRDAHASPFGFEDFSEMAPDDKDTFVWIQSAEPFSLYCAQEADSDSLRACSQALEPLYRYEVGGVIPQPWLAEFCAPNEELTVWTCKLREGVVFQDGSTLDANDVVGSFWVQWDAEHPFHRALDKSFHYFQDFWGAYLNAPSE